MGYEIKFGRWILKYCTEMQDAGIIYWRYNGKDYDTEDLYSVFLEEMSDGDKQPSEKEVLPLCGVSGSLSVDRKTRKGHPESHYNCPHCEEDYAVECLDNYCRKCGGKIHWNKQ